MESALDEAELGVGEGVGEGSPSCSFLTGQFINERGPNIDSPGSTEQQLQGLSFQASN